MFNLNSKRNWPFKKLLVVAILSLTASFAQAQNWLGLSNSNYAGTNGMYLNPSSIVDSRNAGYINLFSGGFNAYNNYLYFNGDYSPMRYLLSMPNLSMNRNNFWENLNGKDKMGSISAELRGPSFMVNINPKHAVGFSLRSRNYVQGVNVSQPVARIMRWGIGSETPLFKEYQESLNYSELYNQSTINLSANSFVEAGLTYATVLYDKNQHFLKGGVTYKRIAGLYTAYFKNEGGSGVTTYTDDSMSFHNTNISYGYVNEKMYTGDEKPGFSELFGSDRVGKGHGFDLGFTYEYRPDHNNLKGNDEANKYSLRLGASLLDVGQIRYNSENVVNNDLSSSGEVYWGQMDSLKTPSKRGAGESYFTRYDNAITKVFGTDGRSNEIVTKLPTAINLNADVRVRNNIYVNVMWLQGLHRKSTVGIRQFGSLSVTPRLETDWMEVAMPVSLHSGYRNLSVGAFIRFGAFFIGSDNISGLLKSSNVNGMDIYTGLVVPIFKRNKNAKNIDGACATFK